MSYHRLAFSEGDVVDREGDNIGAAHDDAGEDAAPPRAYAQGGV